MEQTFWVALTPREKELIRRALEEIATSVELVALMAKLANAAPVPKITIGVYGGQVQWALGNPFPVRICDYDGDDDELPDLDLDGQRCRSWLEPVDPGLIPS